MQKANFSRHFLFQFLLERGGSANAANRRGCAPLAVAAILGEEECARVLLDNGADVNHQVCTGFSSQERAKLRVFRGKTARITQPSPSLTQKPCTYLVIDVSAVVE